MKLQKLSFSGVKQKFDKGMKRGNSVLSSWVDDLIPMLTEIKLMLMNRPWVYNLNSNALTRPRFLIQVVKQA